MTFMTVILLWIKQRPTQICYICPSKCDAEKTNKKGGKLLYWATVTHALTSTCCNCFPGSAAGPIDVETPPARTLSTLATFLHLPPVPMTVRSPVMPQRMTPCPWPTVVCKCFNVHHTKSKDFLLASTHSGFLWVWFSILERLLFQLADLGSVSVNFMAAYHQKTCLNQSRAILTKGVGVRRKNIWSCGLTCSAFLEADGMAVLQNNGL